MDFEAIGKKREGISLMMEEMARDLRIRMIVNGSVAEVMSRFAQKLDRNDGEPIERYEVSDVATEVALMVAARICHEDAEIQALRIERDHYRKVAEDAILLRPHQPMVLPIQ